MPDHSMFAKNGYVTGDRAHENLNGDETVEEF